MNTATRKGRQAPETIRAGIKPAFATRTNAVKRPYPTRNSIAAMIKMTMFNLFVFIMLAV